MAQNDMFVVMYKLLCYLYDCMKRDEPPSPSCYSASALGIPEGYWARIIEEMVDHGFVTGFVVSKDMSGNRVVSVSSPAVTMEGVAFAQENSMMGKARQFLLDAKAMLPFI